jgi:hypothetical protein
LEEEEEALIITTRSVPTLSFVKSSTPSSISPNAKFSLTLPIWIRILTQPIPTMKKTTLPTMTLSSETTMEWLSRWTESKVLAIPLHDSETILLHTVLDLPLSPVLQLPSRNVHP